MFLFGLGMIVGYHAHKYRAEIAEAARKAAGADQEPLAAGEASADMMTKARAGSLKASRS